LKNIRQWDAQKYDEVSCLQEKWGEDLINGIKWDPTYRVIMDAGCGTGRVTKILAQKVGTKGTIYAVDVDPNMVNKAKLNLASFKNVFVIQSDITNVFLPEKVNVVFSNAVLHWIFDHRRLFSHFWELLTNTLLTKKNSDGLLLAQCGGHGNLSKVRSILNQMIKLNDFESHFHDWAEPWYFEKPEDTERLLREIGFENIRVFLSDGTSSFADRKSYSDFVSTIIMRPYLENLPKKQLKHRFLRLFLDRVEEMKLAWTLDYVRLNITAECITPTSPFA
jgi:trans-aconitate 2-methyltransferase